MILKLLKENNFDFSKIPADINSAVELLSIQTRGTFESDNEKLNMLDRTIFESIKNIFPDDLAVIEAGNVVSKRESQDVNDSFNTVMPESYEQISKSKSLPDENFNEPDSFNGKEAAGALIVAKNTGRVLLLLRNEDSGEPSTWAGAGGKVEEGESIEQALQRELQEEIGVSGIEVYPSYVFERENFTFHNFIGVVDEEFVPELNEEHSRYKWANVDNLPTPLHFGFREFLNNIDIKSEIQEIKSGSTVFEKGGLLAPNGKKSNLSPEQYKLVRAPAFKKWFGDWENDPKNASKVIDRNGEPLPVWHGTNKKFTEFDPKKYGTTDAGYLGAGIYFTNVKKDAEDYAWIAVEMRDGEPNMISAFLKIKNPFYAKEEDWLPEGWSRDKVELYTDELKEKGHDGIISKATKEFVAFESTQIKLADGSNKTFDPNNPDIRYEKGGEINKLIASAKNYDPIDEDSIQEKMLLYPKKYKGHVLDNIPKNQSVIMVSASLFEKEKDAFAKTSKGTIAYHNRPIDEYWETKIDRGERPPVLVGVYDGQLRVRDGNHRLNTYLKKDFREIPVILSADAKKYLTNPDTRYATGGGIPERYKSMGFSKVGQKKKSTRPQKKWMVLAKKGDKYKVVHGGQKGMKDFSQHRDKTRQKRFWNRMGGWDSEKASDPFSPLYWHKRFGTWERGGALEDGTIKVVWVDTKEPETLESKMFDSLDDALRYADGKTYLIMELQEHDDDYYKWNLLPYGEHKRYKGIINWSNIFEEGGDASYKEKIEMLYGAGGKAGAKILSKKDTAKYLKSKFKDYQKVNMPAGEIRKLSEKVGRKAQRDWLNSSEFKAAHKRYEKDFEGESARNPDEKIDWNGLNHFFVAQSREQERLEKLNKYRTGGEDALPIFVRAGLPPKEKGKYVASTGQRSIAGMPTGQEWKESGVSVFDAEYFGKGDFIVVNTIESDSLAIAFGESSASGRPLYLVEGEWIGEGADGEPTLDPRTIKVIGELDGKNVFNDYGAYAGFTYAGDKVEHPHKEWILSKSRFEAGGKISENLFSEYGNLKKVNNQIQSRHPKLYVVQGRGYLYWHSDDSDLSLKLAGLYSTSIPIAKPSHQSIGTWLKEADEIMEQVNDSDKKYGAGGFMPYGFSESTFIHASDKKNRRSILENGLGASNNPVIVNGIYTFPKDWGHWGQETFGDKDWYYIKLKKDAKIYWTDADRPIDMEFGRGSSEFKRVYKDLVAKTGKTKKEIAYLQGEEWFAWKTEFSRLMEGYLRDNGYDAIQKGGEVVIVNLDAIQSVLLDNKTPVKLSSQKYHHRHESGGVLLQPEENNLTAVTIRTASTGEPIMIEVSDYLPSSDVKNVVSGKHEDWIEFQYKGERFERVMPESQTYNGLRRRVTGVRPVEAKCHVELLKNGKRFSKIGHSSHYLAHREGEKWKALGMGNDYVVI